MAEKVVLTLTREQAQMVEDACELYARLRIGQFERIAEMMLDVRDAENYCERRDTATALLQTVACVIFGRTACGTPDCKRTLCIIGHGTFTPRCVIALHGTTIPKAVGASAMTSLTLGAVKLFPNAG